MNKLLVMVLAYHEINWTESGPIGLKGFNMSINPLHVETVEPYKGQVDERLYLVRMQSGATYTVDRDSAEDLLGAVR